MCRPGGVARGHVAITTPSLSRHPSLKRRGELALPLLPEEGCLRRRGVVGAWARRGTRAAGGVVGAYG
jgi:hypothetical protein